MSVLFASLLALPTLLAADGKTLVGKPAPPFVAEGCIDAPRIIDLEQLRGEVVLLKFWGIT
jgi:hypothetical protein